MKIHMKNSRVEKMLCSLSFLMFSVPLFSHSTDVFVDFAVAKEYGNIKCLERKKFFNSHNSPGNEFTPQEWNYFNGIKMGMGRAFMVPGGGSSVANDLTIDELKIKATNWGKILKKVLLLFA